MDTLLTIAAWIGVILCAILVITGPNMIGKPRGPFTYWIYIQALFESVLIVLLAGRVLGWW